jgi:hypothetical protein
MRKCYLLFVVVLIVVILPYTASAQFLPGISEIAVYGGVTINGTDEETVAGALTVNVTPRMGIEGEVGVIFAKEEIINLNADLVLNFGSGTSLIVPYILGGAGFLNNGGTDIALNAGAGLKLFVEPNIALRGDFRAFLTSQDGDVHDMERFCGGITLLF